MRSINYAVQARFYDERRDKPLKCSNCAWRRGRVCTLEKCSKEDSAMLGDLQEGHRRGFGVRASKIGLDLAGVPYISHPEITDEEFVCVPWN